MPAESPTLTRAIQVALDYLGVNGKRKPRITDEPIQSVREDGTIEVAGELIRTSGTVRGAQAGDEVKVLWSRPEGTARKDMRRNVVLKHQARRSGGSAGQVVGGDVLEELFIAGTAGSREVYFRNDKQVTNLKLRAKLDGDPVYVKWGTNSLDFVVATSGHHYYICTLSGSADKPHDATVPTATVVRNETPLTLNIPMVTRVNDYTMTGETWYWQGAWDLNPAHNATYSRAASNSISRVVRSTVIPYMNTQSLEGKSTAPKRAPIAVLADLTLDDNRDLILVFQVAPEGLPNTVSSSTSTSSHPVEKTDGTGTAEYTDLDALWASFGTLSTHVIIVNATKQTVLWRSCKDTIGRTITAILKRNHTYQIVGGMWDGTVEDFSNVSSQKGKNGIWLKSWSTIEPGHPSFEEWADTCDMNTDGSPRVDTPYIDTMTWNDFDPAKVPMLDFTGQFVTDVGSAYDYAATTKAFDPSTFGNEAPNSLILYFTRTGRRMWQKHTFAVSAQYLPRRKSGASVPLGRILLKVKKTTQASRTSFSTTTSFGFYVVDLLDNSYQTLAPLALNYASFSGVNLTPPGVFFVHLAPETNAVFVTLAYSNKHVLWLHQHKDTSGGTLAWDVKLSRLSDGNTKTVATGATYAAIKSVVDKQLQLMRTDFLYYPNDANATNGNKFALGWDAQGKPTLSSSDAGFPKADPALKGLGVLKKLPSGVTPLADTVVTSAGYPVNLEDYTQTGPVWHVVNDQSRLKAKYERDS